MDSLLVRHLRVRDWRQGILFTGVVCVLLSGDFFCMANAII